MPDPRASTAALPVQLSTPADIVAFASEHARRRNSVNCATSCTAARSRARRPQHHLHHSSRAPAAGLRSDAQPRDRALARRSRGRRRSCTRRRRPVGGGHSSAPLRLAPRSTRTRWPQPQRGPATVRRVTAPEPDGALLEALAEAALARLRRQPQELCNLPLTRRPLGGPRALRGGLRRGGASAVAQASRRRASSRRSGPLRSSVPATRAARRGGGGRQAARRPVRSTVARDARVGLANLEVEHAPCDRRGERAGARAARSPSTAPTSSAHLLWHPHAAHPTASTPPPSPRSSIGHRARRRRVALHEQQLLYVCRAWRHVPPTQGRCSPRAPRRARGRHRAGALGEPLGIAARGCSPSGGRVALTAARGGGRMARRTRRSVRPSCCCASELARAVGHIEMGLRAIAAAEGGEDDGEAPRHVRAARSFSRSATRPRAQSPTISTSPRPQLAARRALPHPAPCARLERRWRRRSSSRSTDDGVAAALAAAGRADGMAALRVVARRRTRRSVAHGGRRWRGLRRLRDALAVNLPETRRRWPCTPLLDACCTSGAALQTTCLGTPCSEGADGCEALAQRCRERRPHRHPPATARSCTPTRRRTAVVQSPRNAHDARVAAHWRETAAPRFRRRVHASTGVASGFATGLSSGGGLDAAAAARAARLAPPPRARVLDFASGSGAPRCGAARARADHDAPPRRRRGGTSRRRARMCRCRRISGELSRLAAAHPPSTPHPEAHPHLIVSPRPSTPVSPTTLASSPRPSPRAPPPPTNGGALWFVAQEQVPAGRLSPSTADPLRLGEAAQRWPTADLDGARRPRRCRRRRSRAEAEAEARALTLTQDQPRTLTLEPNGSTRGCTASCSEKSAAC